MPISKRGETDDSFTLNIDLATTILGAAQVDVPPGVMQGRDFSDLYLKKDAHKNWRKDFFYEHPQQRGRVIPKSSALVRKDYKYILYDGYGAESLYHLEKDPMEMNDVLNNPVHRTKLAEIRRRYQELKYVVKMPIADNSTIM
jgi:arylsulfatase A-like enzyme